MSFVPLLALIVRRLRDVGIHWAYIFIVFISFRFAITFSARLSRYAKSTIWRKSDENSEQIKRTLKTLSFDGTKILSSTVSKQLILAATGTGFHWAFIFITLVPLVG